MRIAIVYDCLYPNTVGGAERWLRVLSERLGKEHDVTYLTRRQWAKGEEPEVPGVRVVPVSPAGSLYTRGGRRRLQPPLLFGAGVFLHFLRLRRAYDVVHCVSYPYFSLIGLRLALIGRRETRIFCEWIECLTADYWRAYSGRVGGLAGRFVQWLALRLSPRAFVFSDLNEIRVRQAGFRGELHRLSGLWSGTDRNGASPAQPAGDPLVVFLGRHVPDKRVTVLPDAVLAARGVNRRIRAVVVGDGPQRPKLLERIAALGLENVIEAPGFLQQEELDALLRHAWCLVSPSVRDGHGMAVVEAAAAGLPVVVCNHPDNAATEHVVEGVNGSIAEGSSAEDIAAALLRVVAGGPGLRASTAAWFAANRTRLSMDESIRMVRAAYLQAGAERRPASPLAAPAFDSGAYAQAANGDAAGQALNGGPPAGANAPPEGVTR